ncbi:YveK family protein [Brachybacterium squillarum]|uniref:YveK family protein n=1 Tax=Brachybacterium squillarum TaxID=661979 RepID=UPI00222230BB|nr:hypothetical protein [Brachybacterium squillarum]MCW1803787.1 hypothetical protein [Brachybacterium squillarum]
MEDVPYARILREGWIVVVVATLLGAIGAWGVTRVLPQTYTASSTMMLRVDSTEASLFERNQFSMARITSYPALVDSPEVIDGVREDLDLDPRQYPDRDLRAMLSAENEEDTVLLVIRAEAPTAELSARIANSAAEHLSALVAETENGGDPRYEVALNQVIPASPPSAPTSPQVTAIVGLGLIAGLAIGAILSVYRTTTNQRLLTIADVRRASGLPVVGQIPRSRGRVGRSEGGVVAHQDFISNLRALGGAGRSAYVLVPAGASVLDDDLLEGIVHACHGVSVDAAVLDVRAAPSASEHVRPLTGPARDVVDAMVRLQETHDAVFVVCDPGDVGVLEGVGGLGAGVVVAARHGVTAKSELLAVVTRLRVMGIRPLGVLMTHLTRGAVEAVAETWRSGDRERSHLADPAVRESGVGGSARLPRRGDGQAV